MQAAQSPLSGEEKRQGTARCTSAALDVVPSPGIVSPERILRQVLGVNLGSSAILLVGIVGEEK